MIVQRPMRALALACVTLLAAACATRAPEKTDVPPDPPAPPAPEVRGVSDDEMRRALASAERRIDEYAALAGHDDRGAVHRRRDLRRALEAFATEHVAALLARAGDPKDPAARRQAVLALGFARDRRVTPALVAALGEKDAPQIQNAAGFALASVGDRDTPLAPLAAAARSPDADVRVNALLAIRRVLEVRGAYSNYVDDAGRRELFDLLPESLADPDPDVRANAATVAGALGDSRAVALLLPLLQDTDLGARTDAAAALGELGNRDTAKPLLDAIDATPRGPERDAVIEGLRTLLERQKVRVPERLADNGATWAAFTQQAFDDLDRKPLR